MAKVERSLEGLAKEWQAEGRRIEAVKTLADEADELARSADLLAEGLEQLAAHVEEAEARAASLEEEAKRTTLEAEEAARVPARGEAQLLRVGFRRHREPEPLGEGPSGGLRDRADREQRPFELAVTEHVQHVGLILRPIGAAEQPAPAFLPIRSHVVTRRDEVDSELVGSL